MGFPFSLQKYKFFRLKIFQIIFLSLHSSYLTQTKTSQQNPPKLESYKITFCKRFGTFIETFYHLKSYRDYTLCTHLSNWFQLDFYSEFQSLWAQSAHFFMWCILFALVLVPKSAASQFAKITRKCITSNKLGT